MAERPAPRVFTIDVVSDVVCPWCYIGKRRLAAALARLARRHGDVDFQVSWHPFQLNPDLPAGGVDRRQYLEDKFGGPERAAAIYARVREAGTGVGIPFAFERIERQPNTLDAHRLVSWAQRQGPADALIEALFRACFLDGRYLGDRATLATIAGEAGFDAESARAMLAGDEGIENVRALDARVRELGVTGVPFFIFDNRVAVAGAQEPEALIEAIEEALAAPVDAA
ncbi:MAG: DsbA family oxidoreductase [Betaproteobacteria bacterium]|nr:DsbA family oxidoreductase [Betaproteobacteria bacterium]